MGNVIKSNLKPGSKLQAGRYTIIKPLGQGGFGITYLAKMKELLSGNVGGLDVEVNVAIKEFFLRDDCERDDHSCRVIMPTKGKIEVFNNYKAKFKKEADIISKLNHGNIVKVFNIFEENDTIYYVMQYIRGESLHNYVKKNGPLSEEHAMQIINQLCTAVDYIHSSRYMHLDIKPDNILLEGNNIKLIDFGLSKHYDKKGRPTVTSNDMLGISEGYSPIEQYSGNVSKFCPQIDIYSLGATIAYMLTGKVPSPSTEMKLPELPVYISESLRKAVLYAMQSKLEDRPQNITDFVNVMQGKRPTTILGKTLEFIKKSRWVSNIIVGDKPHNRTQIISKDSEELKRSDSNPTVIENPSLKKNNSNSTEILSMSDSLGLTHSKSTSADFSKSTEKKVVEGYKTSVRNSKEIVVNGVSFTMVNVKGGTFTMGATMEQNIDANPDEKPTRRIKLRDYSIGKTLVTQELWEAVMGNNPSVFKGKHLPVENVSWHDCQEFISRLNMITHERFRMPTEAEWEYAARGGNLSNNHRYSGSNDVYDVAWHNSNSKERTHTVGKKEDNELGLYDMSGNVWEWCMDWYGSYNSNILTNPAGPAKGSSRVLRGGCWDSDVRDCRVSNRIGDTPNSKNNHYGMRLVCSSSKFEI